MAELQKKKTATKKTSIKKVVKKSVTKKVKSPTTLSTSPKKDVLLSEDPVESIKQKAAGSKSLSFLKRFSEQLDRNVSLLNKRMPVGKKKILMRPATLFARLAAFITDLMIIDLIIISWFRKYLLALAPEGNLNFSSLLSLDSNLVISQHLILITTIIMLLCYAYFAFFEYKFGQTPGKMFFRLKVISSKPLLKRIKQYNVDINSVTQKIINSGNKTVDIHEEIKKDQSLNQVRPESFALNFWQALGRSLYFIPILPFVLVGFTDLFFLVFKRRRLSDTFTKTTVVETIPVNRLEKLNNLIKKYFNNNNNN